MPGRPIGHGDAADRRSVIELARRQFTSGQRLDMQAIAAELGIGRTTLYRWVGDREALLGEALAVIAARTCARCYASAGGWGNERIVRTMQEFMRRIARSKPMRQFLSEEPQTALRLLMSPESPVVVALSETLGSFVRAEQAGGHAVTGLSPDDVAWIAFQLGLSCCWTAVVTGEEPDVARAASALHAVLRA
jgi:AcrR family transcriptional regulator